MNPLLVKESEKPAEVFERHFKTEEAGQDTSQQSLKAR